MFDIAERFDRTDRMEEVIEYYTKTRNESSIYNQIMIKKVIYLAKTGRAPDAKIMVSKIKNFPEAAIERLYKKINLIEEKSKKKNGTVNDNGG